MRDVGFFTIAQNSGDNDYVKMAYLLALSLQHSQHTYKRLSIGVTPGEKIPEKYLAVFDQVVEIPWIDHAASEEWKLANEWKVFHMTPYDETVKLDADMVFGTDISSLLDRLQDKDVAISTAPQTYTYLPADMQYYRSAYDVCDVPNCYNAFSYFKRNRNGASFYEVLQKIFLDWENWGWEYFGQHMTDLPTTDAAYGMAVSALNRENDWLNNDMKFVHMKSAAQRWERYSKHDDDWQKSVPWFFDKDMCMHINNIRQRHPVHYNSKSFDVDTLVRKYEEVLNIC